MYLLPHVNHVCDTDAIAVYSLFLTCYTITYFHGITVILVDTLNGTNALKNAHSYLCYECQAQVKLAGHSL